VQESFRLESVSAAVTLLWVALFRSLEATGGRNFGRLHLSPL
jgi:hypothetical protein